MLVPSRTASLAVCRQASSLTLVARLRPTGWLCCLSYPAQFARPLSGSAARVRASSTQRDGELKRQIISSANKIRFRYDIDNHKALTDAALDKAEKAIG